MHGKYEHFQNGIWTDHKKIVLALLQQCKDAGLTVSQALFVLDQAKREIDEAISRSPIMF